MLRATELAHSLLRQVVKPGDWAVDATAGNGHDTLFLAGLAGEGGRVFSFDVQKQALAATAERTRGLAQVTLFHSGHERMADCLPPEARGRLRTVMFNLGYMPGEAKAITTRSETTQAALDRALDYLGAGGLVSLILYTGHPGGAEEAAAVRSHAERLPPKFAATHFTRLNSQKPAPELLLIERLRS